MPVSIEWIVMNKGGSERVLLFLACFIVLIWGIGVLVEIIFPNRMVPASVHQIALVVVASLYGGAALSNWKRNKNGKNGNDESK